MPLKSAEKPTLIFGVAAITASWKLPPSGPGNEIGIEAVWPAMQSRNRAQSRTERAIGPCVPSVMKPAGLALAARPGLGRMPTMPQ